MASPVLETRTRRISRKRMHIFDVDHTITRRSTGRHFVATAIKMDVVPRRVLFSLINVSLRYRIGKLSSNHINRDFPSLMGVQQTLLEEVAHKAFEEKTRGDMYPKAIDYIKDLEAKGEEIAIATSSFGIVVKPLTEYLGIRKVISSSIEFENGRCTGRIIDTPAFHHQKKEKVLQFLAAEGVPAEQCSFYSDSIYDLPLMETVGDPVPTNPDLLLARHAKRVGWRILNF
jgi:HAD superfamily hydrolase (TIGR01490 family)